MSMTTDERVARATDRTSLVFALVCILLGGFLMWGGLELPGTTDFGDFRQQLFLVEFGAFAALIGIAVLPMVRRRPLLATIIAFLGLIAMLASFYDFCQIASQRHLFVLRP